MIKEETIQNAESSVTVLVSVIVSTFRRDWMLERALLSLCNQTYDYIEIIVVDDNGEIDWNRKVFDIIESIKKQCRFPINLIVSDKKVGASEARNKGIDLAKGEYITFLDDDDVYLEDKIDAQLKDMLRTNADYGLTDLYLYNSDDKLVDQRVRFYLTQKDTVSLLRYHILYHMTGTDTLIFKKDYLISLGRFPNVNVGDEFFLMLQAIMNDGVLCYSPDCKVKAYIHSGENTGLSSGYGKIDGENFIYHAKKKYLHYLSKDEVNYVKVRHWAVLAYTYLRMKNYPSFFGCAIRAFFSSPAKAIKIRKEH